MVLHRIYRNIGLDSYFRILYGHIGLDARISFQAACNNLTGKTAAEFKAEQNAFIQNDFRPLLWIYIFLFINYIIISKGVQKGIEKMSNILMPILFIILIVFAYDR